MSDVRETIQKACSQALVNLDAAAEKVEKVVSKILRAAGFAPENVRRRTRAFTERLQSQRKELGKTFGAVKRAASRFKLASRYEVDGLRQRVDEIGARLDAMTKASEETPS
jgi:polyhydroxyalkanoate synthesis regulator phasin